MTLEQNGSPEEHDEDPVLGPLPPHDDGIERNLFGKWTIRLRNLGGILATITLCVTAIFNCYTTHISVAAGHGFPSNTQLFIMNVGPIIVSWTFMNVNKTISTIMRFKSEVDKLREKLAGVVAPKKDESNTNG